jgi:hypothetical protein
MSQSTGGDAPQPDNRSRRARRSRSSQKGQADRPVTKGAPHDEAGFWAQLEEREYGRLAQEADHLFDTSYLWAA